VRAAPLVASQSLVRDALDVSALQLIAEPALVAAGFTVVTAPREADPQLVSMWLEGVVDGIWTRDGDAFVHGAQRTIWQGNFFSGVSQTLQIVHTPTMDSTDGCARLQFARCCRDTRARLALYRMYASLAGCDYLKLDNIGPATAAAAVHGLYKKVVDAAAGEPGAFTWKRLHEPGIAGDDGVLAELLRQVAVVKKSLAKHIADDTIAASRGNMTGGLLRAIERAYYAFAGAPIYSFLFDEVRCMYDTPPTDELKEYVGVTAPELEAMYDPATLFHGSVTAETWWGQRFNVPRYPGSEYCEASRYSFGVRYTHYYVMARLQRGPQLSLSDDLSEWLQATRSTKYGDVGQSRNDLVKAVNHILETERSAALRRLPTVRPKGWRPVEGSLRGGPAPTRAQKRRLLQRLLDGSALPAVYDASADAMADNDADAAAAKADAPVPILLPAAQSKRARFVLEYPKPLSLEFFNA